MGVRPQLAVLADYANVSQEGKLNICGIFSNIASLGIPLNHPQLHVIVVLESERSDAGEHTLALDLIKGDGSRVIQIAGTMALGTPEPGQTLKTNHIFKLANVRFDAFGAYEFKVLVDGEVLSSIPMQVSEAKRA
jgi:hypothetical protein